MRALTQFHAGQMRSLYWPIGMAMTAVLTVIALPSIAAGPA